MIVKQRLIEIQREIIAASTAPQDFGMDVVRDEATLDQLCELRYCSRRCLAALALCMIATYHPFFQANKRTAFIAAEEIEGGRINVTPEEAEDFLLKAATGAVSVIEAEAWIGAHITKDPGGITTHYDVLDRLSRC